MSPYQATGGRKCCMPVSLTTYTPCTTILYSNLSTSDDLSAESVNVETDSSKSRSRDKDKDKDKDKKGVSTSTCVWPGRPTDSMRCLCLVWQAICSLSVHYLCVPTHTHTLFRPKPRTKMFRGQFCAWGFPSLISYIPQNLQTMHQ